MPQAKLRTALTITALFMLLFEQLLAQDSLKFRKMIKAEMKPLVSNKLKGRGYTGGDSLTANYLTRRLSKLATGTNAKVCRDTFRMPVNVFGQRQHFRLGNKSLKPGIEFVAEADCPSVKRHYSLYHSDTLLLDSLQQHITEAWVLPIRFKARLRMILKQLADNQNPPALIWLEPAHKITWSVADDQATIPSFTLLTSVWERYKAPTASVEINAKVNEDHHAHNVWLDLPAAAGSASDSTIYITAHYDHLGQFGSATYYGANDNASGVAMALLLAESIKRKPLRHRVRILFFAGEEAGLLGSVHYVKHRINQTSQAESLNKIKLVLNLDLMSAGDKGMTVVNGTILPAIYDRIDRINKSSQYLPVIKARGKAANSDHYPFSEAGIPAIFCYTMGGTTHYHDPGDTLDRCSLTHVKRTHDLLLALLQTL